MGTTIVQISCETRKLWALGLQAVNKLELAKMQKFYCCTETFLETGLILAK